MTFNGYLFAAYLVVWIALFTYLVYLNRRQKQVAADLRDLAEDVSRQKSKSSSAR